MTEPSNSGSFVESPEASVNEIQRIKVADDGVELLSKILKVGLNKTKSIQPEDESGTRQSLGGSGHENEVLKKNDNSISSKIENRHLCHVKDPLPWSLEEQ